MVAKEKAELVQLTFRIPPEVLESIRNLATLEERTFQATACRLLRDGARARIAEIEAGL